MTTANVLQLANDHGWVVAAVWVLRGALRQLALFYRERSALNMSVAVYEAGGDAAAVIVAVQPRTKYRGTAPAHRR